ncbi:hypothetical protein SUGI_0003900 [Cryptomeria japonica]|nr:hypothetical protein SUGI_0003900 [Cryptomeria japonica]
MGCNNSKDVQARGEGAVRPLPRCSSTPPIEKQQQGHNYYHLVSVKSSTYGNLHLKMSEEEEADDFLPRKHEYPDGFYDRYRQNFDRSSNVAAKTWSDVNNLLSDYKIPCKQENGKEEEEEEEEEEPETINTWELMEGLEDANDCALSIQSDNSGQGFHPTEENARKPLWMHFADDSSDTLFDPDIVCGFREAFDTASKVSVAHESLNGLETPVSSCSRASSRFRCNSFPRPINKSPFRLDEVKKPDSENNQGFPRASSRDEDRVILYFTSLRAIRKTYEDCCNVRLILQGFRIFVDERDVSLHSGYREELQRLLGNQRISVPMLFVRGEYIGGADRVIQLHEEDKPGSWCSSWLPMSSLPAHPGRAILLLF